MLPPLTDLVALLGIDLVLCAGVLRLLDGQGGHGSARRWAKGVVALCFVLLWLPVGAVQLPLLAFVRGISSDLSVTLVALAGFFLMQRFWDFGAFSARDRAALWLSVALAAVFLYPLALGWGDWDAYRTGWGSWGLWAALLALALLCWLKGLRLLPLLLALSLLAWSANLMESRNLWDYLLDPWLAIAAWIQCLMMGARWLRHRFRPA
ncbi:MAG: hypothetical protein ABIR13_09175 [Polaromonas sp.]